MKLINWFKDNKFIILVLTLSGFLYFYNLEGLSPAVHNDEAMHGFEAIKLLHGEIPVFGTSNYYNLPNPSLLHFALTILIFGENIVALRVASAIVGVATVYVFYVFTKSSFDEKIAKLAVVLFALSHYWIAFSRMGINYNLSVLYILTLFMFLFRVMKADGKLNKTYWLLFGSVFAISLYLYFSARVVMVIIPPVFLYLIYKKIVNIKSVFVFVSGALIVSSPMLISYFNNPISFNSRTNNVFLFSPEVKSHVNGVYKTDSALPLLFYQTIETFNISADNCESSGQYGYCGRFFDLASILFITTGVVYSIKQVKEDRFKLLLFWFVAVIIFGSILTVPPRFMPRLLGLLPVVYILCFGFLPYA